MQKLIGNLKRGLVFVLSAPAGTGKTTLVRMLADEFPCIHESISCTTRLLRKGEVEGRDYHFLSKNAFEEKLSRGEFLEHAEVFGHYYGTSATLVEEKLRQGKHVFLVIDTQGAMTLQEKKIPAVYVFLSAPSHDTLRERLIKRQTEGPDVIEKRLLWAKEEMARIDRYDYHIVNDDLALAYAVLRSIVIAEEHKTRIHATL